MSTLLHPGEPGGPTTDAASTPPPGSPPPRFCLYLLVCQADTGPLAGLFKLGISDCLARRHQEHRLHWPAFDLARSVVVWADSREEVQHLETTVRHTFGAPKLEAQAKAAGHTLSNAELRAAGSRRRHPGRRARGWTEFYTVACLEEMVQTLAHLVERRCDCQVRACLQRGLTPAELGLLEGGTWSPGLVHGPGAAKQRELLQRQEQEERERLVKAKLAEVLAFALAHEDALRWVDLSWWQHLRATGRVSASSRQGLVDLYFGPFHLAAPRPGRDDAWSDRRSAAQRRFEASFAAINPVAGPVPPRTWRWTRPRQVCSLQDLPAHFDQPRPHPACADTLVVWVEPVLANLESPLFERFADLGQRVAKRWVG